MGKTTPKGSRQPMPVPTNAEMRLLQILWGLQEGTVEDVVNAHSEKEKPNYKTTQTLLRIMEQKALITHEARGKVFVFRPMVSRDEVNRSSVQRLLSQNFGGSAAALLVNLLETRALKSRELDEVEEQIRQYRRDRGIP